MFTLQTPANIYLNVHQRNKKIPVFLSLQMFSAVRFCPFSNTGPIAISDAFKLPLSCIDHSSQDSVREPLTKYLLNWTTNNKFDSCSFYSANIFILHLLTSTMWTDDSKHAFKMFVNVVILPHVWSVKVIDLSIRLQICSLQRVKTFSD